MCQNVLKSGTCAAGNWALMFLPHDIDVFGSLITEQTHDNIKYIILYNEQKRKKNCVVLLDY